MGQRDAIIGKRKTATDGIPELIDKIRKEFTILDDLVPSLIKDEKCERIQKQPEDHLFFCVLPIVFSMGFFIIFQPFF